MAQHDYEILNQSGKSFRDDLNAALSAIASNNSGATAPSVLTSSAYQFYANTTSGNMQILNAAKSAWIDLFKLDGTGIFLTGAARIKGDFTNTTYVNRAYFQTSTTNSITAVGAIPNGTATSSGFFGFNNSTPTNAAYGGVVIDSVATYLRSSRTGTGTALPIYIQTGDTPTTQVIIDTSGNVGIGRSPTCALDVYTTSGNLAFTVDSDSLANNQQTSVVVSGGARAQSFSVYKHSGITNPCGYVSLNAEDNALNFLWTDNSDILRISTTATNIGTTGGSVVGDQASDERIKNILGPVEYGLDALKQIEPVRYTYKSNPDIEKIGFIAQQVQPIVPQSVYDTKDRIEGEPEDAPTKLAMEYAALIPVLVNAMKELSAEVDALKAQLP